MAKIIRLTVLFLLLFVLNSCSSYGEKRIVKLVTADKEKIEVYYYDYSSDKPEYIKETKPNNGIENTLTEIFSQNEYDLKLCRNFICDKEIIKDNIYDIYSAVINCKFSPDITVMEADTKTDLKAFTEETKGNYPIYSYNIKNNKINGIVEIPSEGRKNIIADNTVYKKLENGQSVAVDILNKKANSYKYTFTDKGKRYSANLENVIAFYTKTEDNLSVYITAVLNSYKGMPSNKSAQEQFIVLLKKHLAEDMYMVLKDEKIKGIVSPYFYNCNIDYSDILIEIY